MCIYNCNKYRGERFTFLVNVEFYISQKFFLSQKLRLQQNSPIWISTYLSISHQLTYILAIQTIKTVLYKYQLTYILAIQTIKAVLYKYQLAYILAIQTIKTVLYKYQLTYISAIQTIKAVLYKYQLTYILAIQTIKTVLYKYQLTYILAIQTIKTVPYLSSVISCRNGIRQGRSRMTLKAMVLQWLNFWAQVCTLTRKKQAIRTLYIIITLFWLDNFGVWEQKSYLNVLTVRHVHWTANQITVYNKYFVLMGQFWSASIKIVLESFDRKACLLTFDIYQGYNVDRCHVD